MAIYRTLKVPILKNLEYFWKTSPWPSTHAMDHFLSSPLVDEQPGMLISGRDFSNYPLHLLPEEQAIPQHDPSTYHMVSCGYRTTNQLGSITIPASGFPLHQAPQPQLASLYADSPHAMLPPPVPLSRQTTYGLSRQDRISKKRNMSETLKKRIREYHLKYKGIKHKAIAGKRT